MQSQRIARFADLRANTQAFVDIRMPGNAREIYSVIGPGVSENAEAASPIDGRGFNLAFVRAPNNNGASLHFHDTIEVFMAIEGQWEIFWKNLEGDEHKTVLNPYDTISVPEGALSSTEDSSFRTALELLRQRASAGDIPDHERLLEAIELLEQHPLVQRLIDELGW